VTMPVALRAGCLSFSVAIVLVLVSLASFGGSFAAVAYLLGACLVSFPVVSAVLWWLGKRDGAKVAFGAWVGILVPTLIIWFFVWFLVRIMM